MRPLDKMPPEFLDVADDLGQPLPLMEQWLSAWGSKKPLADCSLLLVQHQLANHAAQAEGLVRLGADPEQIHWLDIPYTSQPRVRSYINERIGIPIENFDVCDDYRVLAPYAQYQLRRAVRIILKLAEPTHEPLIVLDDGAYILEALAGLRRERWPKRLAIVEQTTRGLIKLKSAAALQAAARAVPIINVAASTPKRTLEPPFIAMSICASLRKAIRNRYTGHSMRRCLVLGYGAVGEQVATFLDRHFEIGRGNVHVFDSDSEQDKKARDRRFPSWDRENFDERFDLVVGCSGRSSFAVGDYVYLEDDALLASASSGAVELSREDFIELATASRSDDIEIVRDVLDEKDLHSDLTFHLVDRTAVMLNAGFPVNFDGRITTTPSRYIQPTPVMMIAAAVQARQALERGQTGVIALDSGLGAWLNRQFREELGSEAHFLEPPPEASW